MDHNFEANSEQVVTLVSVTNRNKTIFGHIRPTSAVVSDLVWFEEDICLISCTRIFLLTIWTFLLTIWTAMKSIHDDFTFQIVMVDDSS
jgi:hypothetical protein